MKKIFFAVLAAATTMNIMATTLEQVKLTMTSASSSANMTIRVVDDANPVSATLYEEDDFAGNPATAYIYAVDGSDNHYQIYKVNAASDIKLGIGTIADEVYTITASNVKLGSAAMKLYDKETHLTHELVEGYSFDIVAATNRRIEDRFVINPIQTEFVCQVAGGLSFHGDSNIIPPLKRINNTRI